jgi:hypothetical protein
MLILVLAVLGGGCSIQGTDVMRSTFCLVVLTALGVSPFHAPMVWAGADEGRDSGRVRVIETPDGGIQPQAAIDDQGVLHLVYFRGQPAGGDLLYARLEPGEERFSRPVEVNSQHGAAVAIGTIRGGQIALGRGGRVHVAWNGAKEALPKNPVGGFPMLYTRSSRQGRETRGLRFEPQRNLMQRTSALDGGGTVAADSQGNVYVSWHGRSEDSPPGEMGRRMWVAHSRDDGATFGPEEPAWDRPTGACACCGTRAQADHHGTVYLLYRAATGGVARDIYLLTSDDRARHFRAAAIHPWKVNICPMSSASLAEAGSSVLAAWETQGEVYFCRVDSQTHQASRPVAPPGGRGDRKHPAVAGNARGEAILVWTEGTGWLKGGSLAWQVFDPSGRPTSPERRIEGGIPVWGLATVVTRLDGGFAIIH